VSDLNIAEIPYPTGVVQHRYARYLAPDGSRWIRHGLFRSYHEDGSLASEGNYEHGVEQGLWRDFYPNGRLAAEGNYVDGQEAEGWRYWTEEGKEEQSRGTT
jgi:antitoxin component YwqK of YwqJK toxin-antitoxin module